MTLKDTFVEAGEVSPLAAGGAFVAVSIGLNLLAGLGPTSLPLILMVLCLWLATGLFFFVVVTWYRDDDWLASGFLLAVPAILGVLLANAVSDALTQGSIAPIIVAAPSAFLAVITRGLILVPLAGGAVALGRRITRATKTSAS